MAIEIVDLPIDSMLIFHSYVTVYQRVICSFICSGFQRIEYGSSLISIQELLATGKDLDSTRRGWFFNPQTTKIWPQQWWHNDQWCDVLWRGCWMLLMLCSDHNYRAYIPASGHRYGSNPQNVTIQAYMKKLIHINHINLHLWCVQFRVYAGSIAINCNCTPTDWRPTGDSHSKDGPHRPPKIVSA